MRVELHPEAHTELRRSAVRYEERRAGLGDEFIAEISATLDRIDIGPESFPRWPGINDRSYLIRRSTVRRSPYVIAFVERKGYLLVLAIAHAKRRPLYWLTRAIVSWLAERLHALTPAQTKSIVRPQGRFRTCQ